MKIRYGFVSNSSSSSFTCDVCGDVESGWDMSLSDADMYECKHYHTICSSHLLHSIGDEDAYIDRYELPSEYCPVCQLRSIDSADILSYILKRDNLTKEAITAEMQEHFATHEDLVAFLRSPITGE